MGMGDVQEEVMKWALFVLLGLPCFLTISAILCVFGYGIVRELWRSFYEQ